MARPIQTTVKVNIELGIKSYPVTGDPVTKEFSIGDTIKDLSYVTEEGEVSKISGRLSDINYSGWKKESGNNGNMNSKGSFKSESVVKSITLDSSKIYTAVINEIPAEEILEYGLEGAECDHVNVYGKMVVDFAVKLSDGTSSSAVFTEGQKIFFTKILKAGKVVEGNFTIDAFEYTVNKDGKVDVKGLRLIDDSNNYVSIPFEAIYSCGKEAIVVKEESAFEEALAKTGDKGIELSAGTFTSAITATTDVTVIESTNNAMVTASSGSRKAYDTKADETVISGAITVPENANITFNGVTITGNTYINCTKADSIKFKNCRFVELTPYQAKSYGIISTKKDDDSPMKVEFEGCYFGKTTATSTGKMYNLFEQNAKVADGSYIKNCYFATDACAHNFINIYDVEDGATLTFENNHFEYSGNAMRIGFKGDAHATVNIINETYDTTDLSDNGAWAGYLIFQPYGTQTTTFENVRVNITGLKNNSGVDQVVYAYSGGADTPLTESNCPKVYIDGKKVTLTILH